MAIASLAIFSLTAGFGWAIIAYEGYATPRGWPIGAWLAGPFSWLQGIAYVALIGAVVASIYAGAWWHAVVVVVAANICVRLLFPIAGPRAQVVALLGIVVGLPLSAAMLWL
jgi:hypothetical protein